MVTNKKYRMIGTLKGKERKEVINMMIIILVGAPKLLGQVYLLSWIQVLKSKDQRAKGNQSEAAVRSTRLQIWTKIKVQMKPTGPEGKTRKRDPHLIMLQKGLKTQKKMAAKGVKTKVANLTSIQVSLIKIRKERTTS